MYGEIQGVCETERGRGAGRGRWKNKLRCIPKISTSSPLKEKKMMQRRGVCWRDKGPSRVSLISLLLLLVLLLLLHRAVCSADGVAEAKQ